MDISITDIDSILRSYEHEMINEELLFKLDKTENDESIVNSNHSENVHDADEVTQMLEAVEQLKEMYGKVETDKRTRISRFSIKFWMSC